MITIYKAVDALEKGIKNNLGFVCDQVILPNNVECVVIPFALINDSLISEIKEFVGVNWNVGVISVPKGKYILVTPA